MADIFTLILVTTVFAGILLPLLRPGSDRDLGAGLEDTDPSKQWEAERARLIEQMQDNDIALAEGRIGVVLYGDTSSRLTAEANRFVDRLRKMRPLVQRPGSPQSRSTGDGISFLSAAAVVVAALGVHFAANVNDLDMTVSPHATGAIPLAAASDEVRDPVMASLGPDGAPNIAEMVGRLEERVYDGNPTEDDIQMLLRSYRVLERGEDAIEVLQIAAERFPGNVQFKMMLLRGRLQDPEFDPSEDLVRTVETVLQQEPDLLEAHWYRGLIQARQGRHEAARETLMTLRPKLSANPRAAGAVDALLAQLETTTQSDN
ncbi:hypothetical protein SPOA0195 (plasmid) [Ruegeria pomeroyi DSS-3]|uniref:Cytochrome c-type biogenesis protein CycH n=2 Tax=Ruegeria pomeroyi TaxID=89184 RepID=Q5LL34_RUEPO|nr:tetratricopeptide repeat protein [Ruegeria pomeroyi]AAV97329.1 hypothetical protein SPOA0195 [Ruegeria pomeroyi DSS-3]NVK96800.1 tetratricopeptide repeat protein [Ruegeria pomeroyi]NVL00018.1 tetratricopeptide repeat protein [Ruegeria pomeroyi]HCE71350.1 hypothetical protein [Ruegeria sp.]